MEATKKHTSLNKSYKFRWIPRWEYRRLQWKSKWGTPRIEYLPELKIEWLWWALRRTWGSDEYWERYVWIHSFNGGDELKAEDKWPWEDMEGNSTWRKNTEEYTKKQKEALKALDDYLEGASEEQLKADRESISYPEE